MATKGSHIEILCFLSPSPPPPDRWIHYWRYPLHWIWILFFSFYIGNWSMGVERWGDGGQKLNTFDNWRGCVYTEFHFYFFKKVVLEEFFHTCFFRWFPVNSKQQILLCKQLRYFRIALMTWQRKFQNWLSSLKFWENTNRKVNDLLLFLWLN